MVQFISLTAYAPSAYVVAIEKGGSNNRRGRAVLAIPTDSTTDAHLTILGWTRDRLDVRPFQHFLSASQLDHATAASTRVNTRDGTHLYTYCRRTGPRSRGGGVGGGVAFNGDLLTGAAEVYRLPCIIRVQSPAQGNRRSDSFRPVPVSKSLRFTSKVRAAQSVTCFRDLQRLQRLCAPPATR